MTNHTQQLKHVTSRHEALMDFMLAKPDANARDAARHLGWSQVWVSIVKNSDSFKEIWAQRRKVHESRVSTTVIKKTEAVADMALDLMGDRLSEIGPELPMRELRETADMALRRLGYTDGGGAPHGAAVNVNVGIVTAEILTSAKEVMVRNAEGEKRLDTAALPIAGPVAETRHMEDTDAA